MSLDPLLHASPVIQIHAAFAVLALIIGAIQLSRTKGDWLHRLMGRTWVAFMAVVALSSFFIWTIRLWWMFSPIHLISIFTLVMLWRGVAFARKHDIRHHMRTMEFTYFLALVVTGLLTFLPGRIMYQVAFGPDGATPQKLEIFAGIVTVLALLALGVFVMRRRRAQPA
jgi:MYXO-CTERM domain-containing protein